VIRNLYSALTIDTSMPTSTPNFKKTPVISRYVSTHAKISNARTPGMHLQSDLSILEKFEETEICNYYF
jgi:ribosomal protein S18